MIFICFYNIKKENNFATWFIRLLEKAKAKILYNRILKANLQYTLYILSFAFCVLRFAFLSHGTEKHCYLQFIPSEFLKKNVTQTNHKPIIIIIHCITVLGGPKRLTLCFPISPYHQPYSSSQQHLCPKVVHDLIPLSPTWSSCSNQFV